ncbi:MAG: deoxynucleoside kinase [Bacteroidetes bacterium]|nr:deoxynucleoside kinase [Bacteroidota bacterium]
MSIKYQYIAIEGVIGVGKTTLATQLSEMLNARLILEEFVSNTFLEKFYTNPERYAFPTEVGFLVERFQQFESEFEQSLFSQSIVSDYFFDKSRIFARLNLNDPHFSLYKKLYSVLSKSIPTPDIILFLTADIEHVKANIAKRGREMENDIDQNYLDSLSKSYFEYLKHMNKYPILVLDVTDFDFLNNEKFMKKIISLLSTNWESGIHHISIESDFK